MLRLSRLQEEKQILLNPTAMLLIICSKAAWNFAVTATLRIWKSYFMVAWLHGPRLSRSPWHKRALKFPLSKSTLMIDTNRNLTKIILGLDLPQEIVDMIIQLMRVEDLTAPITKVPQVREDHTAAKNQIRVLVPKGIIILTMVRKDLQLNINKKPFYTNLKFISRCRFS